MSEEIKEATARLTDVANRTYGADLTPGQTIGEVYAFTDDEDDQFFTDLSEALALITSLTAELTAARAEVERLRKAVKPILAARDAFDLSDRNQASAYYTLVDRPDAAWKALRAAITPAEEGERG